MLFCLTERRLIITGGGMNGKSALPDLAKKVSEDEDWKNMPIEEQERLLQQTDKRGSEYWLIHSLNDSEYWVPPDCQLVSP